jgi:hypothetical protein
MYSLWILMEGLCPSSRGINRLMMMMINILLLIFCSYWERLKNITKPAEASQGRNADTKVFLYYIIHVIHIQTFLFNHSSIKMHQNPWGRFKDLCIHRDRQREATLLYTMSLATRPGVTRMEMDETKVFLYYIVHVIYTKK